MFLSGLIQLVVTIRFSRDVYKDVSKKILLPAKWNLQGMLLWPDSNNSYVIAFNWFCFINLLVAEILHANYIIVNFSDIKKMVAACTTFTTAIEALARTFILILKRRELNEILYKIWRNFWPSDITQPSKFKAIKTMSYFSLSLTTLFLIIAYLATSQILTRPFYKHELVLESVFPFDFEWNQTWIYEALYLWQYFANWYVVFIVTGFDFLLISVVTICTVQYIVLQDVFEHMLDEDFKQHKTMFGRYAGKLTRTQVLIRCLEQHKMLNRVCEQLENSFTIVILIQFFTSTLAICMSAFVMKIDPHTVVHMSGFLTGHLSQLFYYCYVGNDLEFQSTRLADSIYESNWHLDYDKEFNRILILIMQRAQRRQCLTAAGITEMNFASFLRVLRISFSTYTLLDTMLQK